MLPAVVIPMAEAALPKVAPSATPLVPRPAVRYEMAPNLTY